MECLGFCESEYGMGQCGVECCEHVGLHDLSQRAHDVNTMSPQRRSNVMTLRRR